MNKSKGNVTLLKKYDFDHIVYNIGDEYQYYSILVKQTKSTALSKNADVILGICKRRGTPPMRHRVGVGTVKIDKVQGIYSAIK